MSDLMDVLFGKKGDRGVLGNFLSGGGSSSIDMTDIPPWLREQITANDNKNKGGNGGGKPPGTVTKQDAMVAYLDSYDNLIMKLLGLGAIGGLSWLLYQETLGKPTILSKLATSPTGTETIKGAFDVISNMAKASVSSPGLRILDAFIITEAMKKLKITDEAASKSIMTGIAALEGVQVAGNIVDGFLPTFGSKPIDGPTNLTITDARSINYQLPAEEVDTIVAKVDSTETLVKKKK